MNTLHEIGRRISAPALFLATVTLVGCGSAETTETHDDAPPAAVETADGRLLFGAEIGDGTPVALATLFDEADAYDGRTILVEAPIQEVCQVKGCWMTMVDGEVVYTPEGGRFGD